MLVLFIAGMVLGAVVVPPHRDALAFLAWTGTLTALFVGCCWLKGEPPRWRWGDQ